MRSITLASPLAGWCLPLAEVPDAAFAGGLVGEGVAIEPTEGVLHAPAEGEVVPMQAARHAVTLRLAPGVDLLMHVGIDTVALHGEGFEMLVAPGEHVRAGQPLLRFDLDLVARKAPSLATPVILASGGTIVRTAAGRSLSVGDFLMEIAVEDAVAVRDVGDGGEKRSLRVPFEHGIHARPAAQVVGALKPFRAEVSVHARGKSANARSTVALMSLGLACGEVVEARASGPDAAAALSALEALLPAAQSPPSEAAAQPPRRTSPASGRLPAAIGCRGLAIGRAVQLVPPEVAVAEDATDPACERAALEQAIRRVHEHLEESAATATREQREILEAHAELVCDPDLASRAHGAIAAGKSAGFAWSLAARATIATLQALDDARMRERVADLRDLENQVLRVLAGEAPVARRELPAGAILLADELLPSQLLAFDPAHIAGLCTARGGPTSHVAIIAATLGIPALVAAGEAVLDIAEGTTLIVDAEDGALDVDPPQARRDALAEKLRRRAAEKAADFAAARQGAATRDHLAISVYANVASAPEAAMAVEHGAEGCGLLRTEFLFQDRREAPGEAEQRAAYEEIAEALGERPLTIRTLDIGGDKPIAYLPLPREDNPALGLRGLRTSLYQPELLRTQLAAILGMRQAGRVRILLPMVTDLDDVLVVRELLEKLCAGGAPMPALGVMIETPSAALLADTLAPHVDFLSIGTNDLAQFVLAMDRGHPELAARLDGLHPAVLRLIEATAQAGHAHARSVSVCGSLGSDPAALAILIGLGVREISAAPAAIPRLKRRIRTLDASACRALAHEALQLPTAAAVRALVERETEHASPRAA